MSYLLCQANALRIPLADESVQCCVTSPPYWGLRDYDVAGQLGLESTPDEFLASMVAVFREVWRVLREDGTLWLNIGDSYAGQGAASQEQTDADIRFARVGNALIKKQRRVGTVAALKPKDLVGIPWRLAFALQADGWYLRSDIIWAKPNPMPESVTDRPTKSHEYLFLLSKSERYYFDADSIREPHVDFERGANGTRVGSKDERRESGVRTGTMNNIDRGGAERAYNPAGRNIRSVWNIATESYPGSHFATYPRKLVEPCVKAGSKPGDVVLDPFSGTSTTGVVALALKRRYVGLDLSRDYLGQAVHRLTRPHAPIQRPGKPEHHPLFGDSA